tara:strand:- start:349 stop:531 length:183 start_codon:yes stop_codon:yes gene_type:complete
MMSIFAQKRLNSEKSCDLALKMLCSDEDRNDSCLWNIRNMTRMDSTKVAGVCGYLSAFNV